MPVEPRRATPADVPGLLALEQAAFDPVRRASPASLRRSLRSDFQEVWVAGGGTIEASLVLWLHPQCVRVYGVAVHPSRQGQGLGRALLVLAERRAQDRGARRIILEADASNDRLIRMYQQLGYVQVAVRPDFYAPGRHAVRLERAIA